jgi:TonB family protein
MKRYLALSAAAHGLLLTALFFWGVTTLEVPAPGPVLVRLVAWDGGGGREAADTPAVEAAGTEAPRPAAKRPPKKAPAPTPRARAAEPSPASPARIGTALEPTPARTNTDAAGAGGHAVRVTALLGRGGGGGAGGERDRRIAIIQDRIQRALVYPRRARRHGIQGTVHVQFDLTEGGRVRTLIVARSSQERLLDRASIETVRRAQPFPYVEGSLVVPVVFRLTGSR